MKILVTRGFDKTDPIGVLTLRDGIDIPLDSVFALGYLIQERASDGTATKIAVQEISLISDSNYLQYLRDAQDKRAPGEPSRLEEDIIACLPISGDYEGGQGYIETDRMGIDATVAALVTLIHEREMLWAQEVGRLKVDLHFAVQAQDEKNERIRELEKQLEGEEEEGDITPMSEGMTRITLDTPAKLTLVTGRFGKLSIQERAELERWRAQLIGTSLDYTNEYHGKKHFRIVEARLEGNEREGTVVVTAHEVVDE